MVAWEAAFRVAACGLVASAIACDQNTYCGIGCGPNFSTLTFDQPLGAPGLYTAKIGPLACTFELPLWGLFTPCQSSMPNEGLIVEKYAIVGAKWRALSKSANVHIEKDGEVVLSETVSASEYSKGGGCKCAYAHFELAVPDELLPVERTSCDGATATADYAVTEVRAGACPDFDADDLISLDDGAVVVDGEGCTSSFSTWSPACTLSSEFSCAGPSLDATWQLLVSDVLGDGSRLLGTGTINMRAPIVCDGSFQLELRR